MRSPLLAAAAVIGAVIAPPAATAATTIGVLPSDPVEVSKGPVVAFSPTALYTVPSSGVITYWSTSGALPADKSTVPRVSLKVFETTTEPGTGNLVATVVGSSRTFLLESETETLPSRVPVERGEQIGLRFPAPGPRFAAGAESITCSAPGIGAPGTVYTEGQGLTCESGQGVAVSARLEPDADEDGFGDETQDRCVGVTGPAVGCHTHYRGRGGGFPFSLWFSTKVLVTPGGERAVPVIAGNRYTIRVRCEDGYEKGFVLFGAMRNGAVVGIQANGRFDYTRGIAPGNGILGGQTEVAGRLEGTQAHGTVSGTVNMRHHGSCDVVPYQWAVRG